MNVADFNPDVAAAYRNSVIQTIELAKKLEIPVLNMHMIYGVYFTLPHKKVFLFEHLGRSTLLDIHSQTLVQHGRLGPGEEGRRVGRHFIRLPQRLVLLHPAPHERRNAA
jgi:hypothetical protein